MASSRKNTRAKQDRMFQGRRREKENMADFIAKKRDMFLIQMSLDTKRQEIQKLEEKAQMKEDALKKSEMMLEEDAMRFDAFLKENDRKAHDALKRADHETKEKQEKVMEIKKLNQEIAKVETEMSKYEETLNNCLQYKEFLDKLTPPEHMKAVQLRKEARARARAAERAQRQAENGPDAGANDSSDEESDEEDMYFTEPKQLLDIFAQLEERNLFLIQNVQETEEQLEELKQKFGETEKQMAKKTGELDDNIADLKSKIAAENEKAENLKKRTRANKIAGNQHQLLQGLSEKVKAVYTKCGFDADSQPDTLDMLREIEGWLEVLLGVIKHADPGKVSMAEKKKEIERRDRVRQAKKLEQRRQYEERLAKSTARAKAEVIRRTGKQIMFRSAPVKKKVKQEEKNSKLDEEEAERLKFFT